MEPTPKPNTPAKIDEPSPVREPDKPTPEKVDAAADAPVE